MTVLMLGKLLELGLYRAEYLRSHGYNVIFPESKPEAVSAINGGAYDIVVLSYSLSAETAVEFRDRIEQVRPQCPVIALTEQRWFDQKIASDKVVLVSEGPQALLEAIESLQKKGEIRRIK